MNDPVTAAISRIVEETNTPSELTARVTKSYGEGHLFLAYSIASKVKGKEWLQATPENRIAEAKLSVEGVGATPMVPESRVAMRPTNIVLLVGASVLTILMFFPPYVTSLDGTQINAGFAALFAPPTPISHVNAPLLAALLFGVIGVTVLIWGLVRTFELDT